MFKLAFALSLLTIAASAAQAEIRVDNARVRASLGSVPTLAAYMTVTNTGKTADRLLTVSCACAAKAELHETVTSNGVSRMRPAGPLAIAAGGTVALEPAGKLHLMLTGVKKPVRAGETVSLSLRFEKAGTVTARFAATDTPEAVPAGHHHHG